MLRTFTLSRFIHCEMLETRRHLSANAYIEQDEVSDGGVAANLTDAKLVNGWGLAVNPHGFMVADNGTGLAQDYDASGRQIGVAVHIPGHGNAQGAPTGVVANPTSNSFMVANPAGAGQVPANFIFVTENGTIDALSTLGRNRHAVVAVDKSADSAVYKGVALAAFKHKSYLYVANFTAQRVDVFNSTFQRTRLPGSFTDPNLPAGYSPFNIQALNGQLYVSYAQHERGETDETAGPGLGIVDVFGVDGKLVKRFATGGNLNAPWGMAVAPSNFNAFSGDLLVGNFGDGKITAFNPTSGAVAGQLQDSQGSTIVIDGLWGIAFGNGRGGTIKNALYFASGPGDESHGLYGRLLVDTTVADPPPPTPIYPMSVTTSHPTTTATTNHNDAAESLIDQMAVI